MSIFGRALRVAWPFSTERVGNPILDGHSEVFFSPKVVRECSKSHANKSGHIASKKVTTSMQMFQIVYHLFNKRDRSLIG